jgi:hypothetical protein
MVTPSRIILPWSGLLPIEALKTRFIVAVEDVIFTPLATLMALAELKVSVLAVLPV